MHIATGKTGRNAKAGRLAASRQFRIADHLTTNAERAAYLQTLLEDGDARVLTVGLRELAESVGGIRELAERTGLSRESLYRTLSPRGNPRLDTLAMLLDAIDLRLAVEPASGGRKNVSVRKHASRHPKKVTKPATPAKTKAAA